MVRVVSQQKGGDVTGAETGNTVLVLQHYIVLIWSGSIDCSWAVDVMYSVNIEIHAIFYSAGSTWGWTT